MDETVIRARVSVRDLDAAIAELTQVLGQRELAVAFVFCSPCVPPGKFIRRLQAACPLVPLVGCTTAGEIDDRGFHRESCVVLGLGWPGLRVTTAICRDVCARPLSAGRSATREISRGLGLEPEDLAASAHVAISFIDGRCHCEESFIVGAAAEAPAISFVGASSADLGPGFHRTAIFHDGAAHSNAAVVIGMELAAPFVVFAADSAEPTAHRVVVTRAEPAQRLVFELNGRPAAQHYREICRSAGYSLDRALAAPVPFGYYVAGRHHLRSVVAIEGEALRFGCAIDVGTVLRLMQPIEVKESTRSEIAAAAAAVGGGVAAVLAFHSVTRYREAAARGLEGSVADHFAGYPLVGFNSFGEQTNLLHLNHTMTGLLIGLPG